MNIKLWGVRGSIPVSDPDTRQYGGHTSCVVVSQDGHFLVLDGGSGMQKLNFGQELVDKRVDILLTHFHLDHLQGLGFFKSLFNPTMEVHIWGPASSSQSLHARLSRYLSPPLFPVLIRDLPCKLHLHEIANSEFEIGPFRIQSRYVIHPGPTVGFRIGNGRGVFTYIPDHEPALGLAGILDDPHWISGYDLAAGADLLYHDAQYTDEEYQYKKGWGHSGLSDTMKFATLSGVRKLLLAHHDPARTDTQIQDLLTELLLSGHYPFPFVMAGEGMEFELER